MEVTPRQTGGLALLALLPLAVYWSATGRLTPVMTAIGVINILLIAGSVMLMFAPTDGTSQHGNGASH